MKERIPAVCQTKCSACNNRLEAGKYSTKLKVALDQQAEFYAKLRVQSRV